MAFIRPATNYIPDINFGRPLSDAQVFLLTSTATVPQNAADINLAELLTVTYVNDAGNTVEAPQPLRTTKGGCLFTGCKQVIKNFQVDASVYKFAVYDKNGNLEYQGKTNANDFVDVNELADPDVQKVAQNLLLAPEFELIPSGSFLLLRNKTTLQTIARFADASNSSDANLFSLPLEVRRDSHTIINSAGTLGGSVDQVWRTAGLSDAFYEVFNTTKDSESFQILFDTKPARSDGTKKDGTGGGGLTPSDDTYSFDAAMSLQGNRPDATLSFPAVSVEVNQKLKLKRRAGGDTYTITPTATSLTIVNDTTAQTVATITQGGITIGGKTEVLDDVARSSGNYFKTISIPSIAAGSGLTFPISAANTISIVDVDLVVINTAGTARRFFKGTFLSDGNTVTPLTPAVDTLASQFTVDVTLVSGVLTFAFNYVSSVGVSRLHGDVKWTSRSI